MSLTTLTGPKNLTNEDSQLKALKSLKGYVNTNKLTKKQCQQVANDLFNVASSNHETDTSLDVLDYLKQYGITNLGSSYEVKDNAIVFDDSLEFDDDQLASATKFIVDCKKNSLNPNDYWIEPTTHGHKVMSISQATLKDLLKNFIIK